MARTVRAVFFLCLVGVLARPPAGPYAAAGEPRRLSVTSASETRAWPDRLDGLVRSGALALRKTRADTLVPGRQHARYVQTVGGVPLIGADLAVQAEGDDIVS